MGDNDREVSGYRHLFFDSLTQCYVIYVNDDETFIEICGKDSLNIAQEMHDSFFPPTPYEVKTIY